MKIKNSQDERISAQHRKINSEAFSIIMVVLFGAIFIQRFFLNAPFEQYAVEVICCFGVGIYIIVRYLMLGLNLHDDGKSVKNILIVNSIAAGMIEAAIHGVLNYTRYAEHYKDNIGLFIAGLVINFISATILVFTVLSGISLLNKIRQAKIQRKLDDDEMNDDELDQQL